MKVDRALVLHVAGLANLSLDDREVAYYEGQLAKILGHVAELQSMPDDLGQVWRGDTLGGPTPERKDVELPSLPPEVAVAEAPEKAGTAFKVPRIIE